MVILGQHGSAGGGDLLAQVAPPKPHPKGGGQTRLFPIIQAAEARPPSSPAAEARPPVVSAMAPKAKRATAARRASNGARAVAVPAAPVAANDMPQVNAMHYAAVQRAIQTVQNRWPGIETLDALPITDQAGHDSGCKAVFSRKEYLASMARHGCYEAGFNLLSVNLLWSATPSTPIHTRAVTQAIDLYFPTPMPRLPSNMTATVVVQSRTDKVWEQKGNLRMVSPQEIYHAFVLRVAQDIESGSYTDEEMNKHRTAILSCSVIFELLPTEDDQFFKATQLRANIKGMEDLCGRTTVQNIFDVVGFKKRKEKTGGGGVTAAQLLKEYKDHVRSASSSETFSESFFETALYVWEQALRVESIRDIVLAVEEKFQKKTPFDSVYKLEAFIQKGRTAPRIAWCFGYCNDILHEDGVTPGELSIPGLTGKAKGGKGLLDLALAKYDLGQHILNVWLKANSFAQDTINTIANIGLNHAQYRKLCGHSNDYSVDITWRSTLTPSGKLALSLFEATGQPLTEPCKNLLRALLSSRSLSPLPIANLHFDNNSAMHRTLCTTLPNCTPAPADSRVQA